MNYKLLLADDSITIQKVVGIIFTGEPYDLTVVGNGNDALARARLTVPDVMLIDAQMPGKDGYEVCREARQDPALAAVPILLLTGVFEPFDEAKAEELGADGYLAKPFESEVLIEKVSELVALGVRRRALLPPPVDDLPEAELLEIEEVSSLDDPWGMEFDDEPVSAAAVEEILDDIEELEPLAAEEVAAPQTRPSETGAVATERPVTMTEEQLMSALSSVSREVIERIVWEVVPDLAESLIREEIRKIRAGA